MKKMKRKAKTSKTGHPFGLFAFGCMPRPRGGGVRAGCGSPSPGAAADGGHPGWGRGDPHFGVSNLKRVNLSTFNFPISILPLTINH